MPTFTLQPDLSLLEKHGYSFDSELHIESIWTEEQRIAIEEEFRLLAQNYGVANHYDTLLYVILVRHDNADLQYQHIHKLYSEHNRIKELAQFLTLYEPRFSSRPNLLKVYSKWDTFKLTDPVLLEWLGKLVRKAVETGDYIPSELGHSITDFARNENGEVLVEEATLDYRRIATYASNKIRKPTVRERNRVLAEFLLWVYDFIQQETSLRSPERVKFSDTQLNFLYKLAVLLKWLPTDREGDTGPDKDYMYTLLSNHIKLFN